MFQRNVSSKRLTSDWSLDNPDRAERIARITLYLTEQDDSRADQKKQLKKSLPPGIRSLWVTVEQPGDGQYFNMCRLFDSDQETGQIANDGRSFHCSEGSVFLPETNHADCGSNGNIRDLYLGVCRISGNLRHRNANRAANSALGLFQNHCICGGSILSCQRRAMTPAEVVQLLGKGLEQCFFDREIKRFSRPEGEVHSPLQLLFARL